MCICINIYTCIYICIYIYTKKYVYSYRTSSHATSLHRNCPYATYSHTTCLHRTHSHTRTQTIFNHIHTSCSHTTYSHNLFTHNLLLQTTHSHTNPRTHITCSCQFQTLLVLTWSTLSNRLMQVPVLKSAVPIRLKALAASHSTSAPALGLVRHRIFDKTPTIHQQK